MTPDGQIILGDCLEVLPTFAPRSIDLIVADPPYFTTKKPEVGDVQWADQDAYLGWLAALLDAFRRVLKPSGSLYLFCGPDLSARTELLTGDYFTVLNNITWAKHDGTPNRGGLWSRADKGTFRSYFPQQERIIFAEQQGIGLMAAGEDGYEAQCELLHRTYVGPLVAYFAAEKARCGITGPQICDGMAARNMPRYMFERHSFSTNQWSLPTRAIYAAARDLFNAHTPQSPGGPFFARPYEDLEADYARIQAAYSAERDARLAHLRRPFCVTNETPHTDVWDFATVPYQPGKHPCAKPVVMLRHIIRASTTPGALVLDAFAGSAATSRAAVLEGRRYVGIERELLYARQATRALARDMGAALVADPEEETDLAAYRRTQARKKGAVPLDFEDLAQEA